MLIAASRRFISFRASSNCSRSALFCSSDFICRVPAFATEDCDGIASSSAVMSVVPADTGACATTDDSEEDDNDDETSMRRRRKSSSRSTILLSLKVCVKEKETLARL